MPNKLYSQLVPSFPQPEDLLSFEDLTDNNVKSFTYQDLIDAIGGGSGGGVYTVDNGLLENTPFNFQLGDSASPGAPLVHHTHIDQQSFLFQLNDSGDPTLIVDPANGIYQLGKNVSPGAYIALNTTGETATMVAKNANYIAVENSIFKAVLGGGFQYLYLDASSQVYQIGDISPFGGDNNTYLSVEDSTAQFKFNSLGTLRHTLLATGQHRGHQYGVGTFLDTYAYVLGVKSDGKFVEIDPGDFGGGSGGSVYTVDNGLTENPSGNFQLGGTLLQDTTIDTTSSFVLFVTSDKSGIGGFKSQNTGTGIGFISIAVDAAAVYGSSTNAAGINGISSAGIGIVGESSDNVGGQLVSVPASTNTVQTVLNIQRGTTGTAANGIGTAIDFYNQAVTGGLNISNRLISKWTDATAATRTSQFIITGVNSGSPGNLMLIDGNGTVTIPSLAGTGTRNVVVDSNGVLSAP